MFYHIKIELYNIINVYKWNENITRKSTLSNILKVSFENFIDLLK